MVLVQHLLGLSAQSGLPSRALPVLHWLPCLMALSTRHHSAAQMHWDPEALLLVRQGLARLAAAPAAQQMALLSPHLPGLLAWEAALVQPAWPQCHGQPATSSSGFLLGVLAA